MRILVTNDDGINAPGLKVLRQIAEHLSDDVWVVAPESNQSGAAHSLTLQVPLRCEEVSPQTYSVRGTPTDCVIMGVRHVMRDNPPDLVLSGVNRGANLADDVTYSGTIAGAMEAALVGIRAIAMSQTFGFDKIDHIHWDTALEHGPQIIRDALNFKWDEGLLLNVNFPDAAPENVAGITITTQGSRDQALLEIEERHDTWGSPYYWFGFERRKARLDEGTDLWAIAKKMISITPLHTNLTHRESLAGLSKHFGCAAAVRSKTGG